MKLDEFYREVHGQAAYEAWSKALAAPRWDDLPDAQREKWRIVAEAVIADFRSYYDDPGVAAD